MSGAMRQNDSRRVGVPRPRWLRGHRRGYEPGFHTFGNGGEGANRRGQGGARCATILQDVDQAKRRAERIALGKAGIASNRNCHGTILAWDGCGVLSRIPAPPASCGASAASFAFYSSGRSRLIRPAGRRVCRHHHAVGQGFGTLGVQDRILLAAPRGHPLTKRGKIRLHDLRDMPYPVPALGQSNFR
jgi:hypothetical protein